MTSMRFSSAHIEYSNFVPTYQVLCELPQLIGECISVLRSFVKSKLTTHFLQYGILELNLLQVLTLNLLPQGVNFVLTESAVLKKAI